MDDDRFPDFLNKVDDIIDMPINEKDESDAIYTAYNKLIKKNYSEEETRELLRTVVAKCLHDTLVCPAGKEMKEAFKQLDDDLAKLPALPDMSELYTSAQITDWVQVIYVRNNELPKEDCFFGDNFNV